jgi:hypothetical protein
VHSKYTRRHELLRVWKEKDNVALGVRQEDQETIRFIVLDLQRITTSTQQRVGLEGLVDFWMND